MKKLLLTITAIVVVSGGAVLAMQHYDEYQNKNVQSVKTIPQQQADEMVATVKSAAAAEKQTLVVEYNRQVAECLKGQQAYDQLSAFSKSKMADPQCGTEITQ